MKLANRLGCFLFLLGVALIGIVVLSYKANALTGEYVLAGMAGVAFLVLGGMIWTRHPVKPGPPAGRFQTVRKMTTRKPKAAEKK